jgi:hypothetical protein
MEQPLAELASHSRHGSQMPDADLVRLTAAARAAGHRWDAIADACDAGLSRDIPDVIRQQYWITPSAGPGPLFSAAQRAARTLTGRDGGSRAAVTWPCGSCGEQVTDRAETGRPVHAELGHAPGCARLARRPDRRRCPAAGLAAPADPALRRPGRPAAAALAGRADYR